MNLEIFSCLFSENEEKRNMARPVVLEAMKNPQFLDFLVQSLSSVVENASSNENLFLIQSICVVLREEIIKKIDNFSFFEPTQIYYTYKTSFEIIFKLPFSIRHYLIDILGTFFRSYKNLNYVEIISQCLSIIEQNGDIYDVTTALNLMYLWISSQPKIGKSQERIIREQLIAKVIPILSQLLKQTYTFLSSLPPEFLQLIQVSQTEQIKSIFQNDENELKNFRGKLCTIEAHFNFIERIAITVIEMQSSEIFITIDDFKEINNTFASILCLNIHGLKSLIDAKISICDFFRQINYLFKSEDNFSPEKRPHVISFRNDMGPIIINSILNCIQISQDSNLVIYLLNVIYVYIMSREKNKKNFIFDIILVDDFITQILIPSSLLKNDDIQTFYDIPEQYVGFYLMLNDKDADRQPPTRKIVALIVSQLPNEFIEHLFGFLMQPSSNVIEAEAKVFLKTVIFLSFKIPITLVDQTIQEFKENSQMDDFYYASLLILLSSMDKNDDWENYKEESNKKNTNLKDCLEIGIFSLLNSNSQVIRLCAIDLLYNIIDDKFKSMIGSDPNSSSLIPLSDVIEATLKLATEFRHEEIGNFICLLIETFSNFFLDCSLQFIEQLFQIWCIYQEDDKLSTILVSISTIIMNLPKNCEVLYKLSAEMTPAILEALVKNQDCNGFTELIDILGCLSDQIDEPSPEFFTMILSMIFEAGFNSRPVKNAEEEEEEDHNDDVYISNFVTIYNRNFAVVICSLICRRNFFIVENSVNYVLKIIESLYTCNSRSPLLPSGLIITTCLIQSAAATARALAESKSPSFDPSQFISLASKAAEFIQNYEEIQNFDDDDEEEENDNNTKYDLVREKDSFILSVITLSSALIVNEAAAMELLNEKIVNNWIKYHKLSYNVGEKLQFIHWPTIALLILSKYNFNQQGGLLFKKAVNQFLKIQKIEATNDNNKDDLTNFYITDFPFNNLDAGKEFANISSEDQRFQFLTKEKLEKFQDCFQ